MNNSDNNIPEIKNSDFPSTEVSELQNQSISLVTEGKIQENSENEVVTLKQKIDYYEKHLSILLSKYQETANKFIIFRDFFLKNYNNQPNDIAVILKKMNSFQDLNENTHIANLIEENSQLRINFKRSTDLLKQQKEVIFKLKNSNKELNSILEKESSKEFTNQRIEELEKENKDLQSLYEMMINESDELNSKNQALYNQIENYKSNEDKLKRERKILQQRISDVEEELISLKCSQKNNFNQNNCINNSNISKDIKTKQILDISTPTAFIFPEEFQNDIQVRFPTQKSDFDCQRLIEELEVKSSYLESELNRTTESLHKIIKQSDILKQDHKKHWINLKNAKAAIEKYKEIENLLRKKLETAGIEIPKYDKPVFEEV